MRKLFFCLITLNLFTLPMRQIKDYRIAVPQDYSLASTTTFLFVLNMFLHSPWRNSFGKLRFHSRFGPLVLHKLNSPEGEILQGVVHKCVHHVQVLEESHSHLFLHCSVGLATPGIIVFIEAWGDDILN